MTVKGFALLSRRPDLTAQQFHEHWRTIHLELALKIKTTRRYVQLHRTEPSLPGFPSSSIDGVAETWLDDLETFLARGGDPNYAEHAGRDEENFLDAPHIERVRTIEDVRRPGPLVARDTPLVKGIVFIGRGGGVDGDTFADWFLGPWAAATGKTLPDVVREVHCRALLDDSPYGGVTELWWRDRHHLTGAEPALNTLAAALADGPADPSTTVSLVGAELRVIWPDR